MDNRSIAMKASEWAKSKIGCRYSQAQRLEQKVFDCSSLVARAYSAQGKDWFYGGNVPTSNLEVYDDDFELIWPSAYEDIGKSFGGQHVIEHAKNPGDLQFLCTDKDTKRSNKITHVAMVASASSIVHARGKNYGVCTNSIDLYSGKVCAITRYNPESTLRKGMKGNRTVALQKKLNTCGMGVKVDGEYGEKTASAVKKYQQQNGLNATGKADCETLAHMGLITKVSVSEDNTGGERIRITGNTVHVRCGPGKEYEDVKVACKGEKFEIVQTEGWLPILIEGKCCWVSEKYVEKI